MKKGNASIVNILNYFSLSELPTQLNFNLYFTVAKFETGDHEIKFIMLDNENNILIETQNINVKLLKTSETIDEVNFVNFTLILKKFFLKRKVNMLLKYFLMMNK